MAMAREKAAAARKVRAAVTAAVMKLKVDDSFAAAEVEDPGDGDGDALALVPLANPFPSNPVIAACNPLLVDLVSLTNTQHASVQAQAHPHARARSRTSARAHARLHTQACARTHAYAHAYTLDGLR